MTKEGVVMPQVGDIPPRFLCQCTQPQRVKEEPTSPSDSVPHPLSLPSQLIEEVDTCSPAAPCKLVDGWAPTEAKVCRHRRLWGVQHRTDGEKHNLCRLYVRPKQQQCFLRTGSRPRP